MSGLLFKELLRNITLNFFWLCEPKVERSDHASNKKEYGHNRITWTKKENKDKDNTNNEGVSVSCRNFNKLPLIQCFNKAQSHQSVRDENCHHWL